MTERYEIDIEEPLNLKDFYKWNHLEDGEILYVEEFTIKENEIVDSIADIPNIILKNPNMSIGFLFQSNSFNKHLFGNFRFSAPEESAGFLKSDSFIYYSNMGTKIQTLKIPFFKESNYNWVLVILNGKIRLNGLEYRLTEAIPITHSDYHIECLESTTILLFTHLVPTSRIGKS